MNSNLATACRVAFGVPRSDPGAPTLPEVPPGSDPEVSRGARGIDTLGNGHPQVLA